MIIADYHLHSDFSSDSSTPMEQMIEWAIQLGLKKLCFTDHMDYDIKVVNGYAFTFNPEKYMVKINEMKEMYREKLQILTGIELGLQPHLSEKLTKLIQNYSFDFVIGSSHVVNRIDPYFPEYWENRTKEEGMQVYFETILENCKAFQGFHVYGHLDYAIRYVPGQPKVKPDYSYEDYKDLLDEVLKTLISYSKGIEVNTAGLKYGLGFPHPKTEVLLRYKELGGEIITIGSDAHRPEHLYYDFDKVSELLKSLGFKYYTTFEQGIPSYEKL